MRCLMIATLIVFLPMATQARSGEFKSLHDLVLMAYEKSPEVKSFEFEAKAQEAFITAASGLDSPMVGLSMNDQNGSWSQYLTVSQQVRFPNKYFLSSKAQKAVSKSASALLTEARLRVRSQISVLYYSLYSTQKEILLTKANMESVREFARVAEKKYAAGKTARSDSMKAHFELTQLELEMIRLRQEEEALQAKLYAAINDTAWTPLQLASKELAPPEFYENRVQNEKEKLEDLLTSHSPTLQAASFKLEETQIRSRLAQWEYAPDFQLQYQHRIKGNAMDRSMFGVGVSIPLWFWNQNSNVQAAKSQKLAQEHKLKDLNLKLSAEVLDLLGKVKTGLKTLKVYQTSLLPQAQSTYNSSRLAYQANKTSFLDLLDSERSLYRVQTGYYKSLSLYVTALSQLESLMGFEVSNLATTKGVSYEK
ncbi:MAG: TolC family protein [Bdellovibrionaceae bacterium]|nr:TolC family protein [Pseudobdellovibrionaceae bacterium]